jgi:anti-anti-sigma factor
MQLPPPEPRLEVTRGTDRIVVRVTGCDALDEFSSPVLLEQLSALPLAAGDLIVLDLSGLHFTTSTGLGALVAVNNRIRGGGGRFVLANASTAVREALAITRLDAMIESLPTAGQPA